MPTGISPLTLPTNPPKRLGGTFCFAEVAIHLLALNGTVNHTANSSIKLMNAADMEVLMRR